MPRPGPPSAWTARSERPRGGRGASTVEQASHAFAHFQGHAPVVERALPLLHAGHGAVRLSFARDLPPPLPAVAVDQVILDEDPGVEGGLQEALVAGALVGGQEADHTFGLHPPDLLRVGRMAGLLLAVHAPVLVIDAF